MARRAKLEDRHIEGIRVVDQWAAKGHQNCKHWLFRVWNPWLRTWAPSKAWAELADGWVWADRERSKYKLEERRTVGGSFAALASDYVQSLTDAGREKRYVDDVRRVLDHLVDKGVADLQADDFAQRVRTVVAAMKSFAKGRQLPVTGKTRNRWMRQVRGCISHGLTNSVIRHDPLAPLRRFRFKEDEVLPEVLPVGELRALVEENRRDDPAFLQTAIMIYCGMRAGEAANFRWEWLDWSTDIIRVRLGHGFKTKRNKERLIPLQPELRELLKAVDGRQLHGWVFEKAVRERKDWQRYAVFKAYIARCGITRTEPHPHSTRHSWAAVMLATGASATLVRRALGHTTLFATDIYADAELTFRRDVKGWPPGEFYLRRPLPPVAVVPATPAGAAAAPGAAAPRVS